MKKYLFAAFIAGSALNVGAVAQDHEQQDNTEQSATTSEQSEEEFSEEDARMQEVVCREENVTGSLTRVNRTCLTRAEWDAIERRTLAEHTRMTGRASGAQSCRWEGLGAVCY